MNYGYTTSEQKIKKLLNKEFYQVVSIKNVRTISSLFNPTFIPSLEYFSYLSKCNEAYNLEEERRDGYEQICMKCSSVSELYVKAYDQDEKYGLTKPGRVIISSKNFQQYIMPENKNEREEWLKTNAFNYHLLQPESMIGGKYEIMKTDLSRYFKLKASVERRKIRGWVLQRISSLNKLKTRGGVSVNNFYYADIGSSKNDSIRFLKNVPYSSFSQIFENYIEFNFGQPFFDKTMLTGNIDIEFLGSVIDDLDYAALRKELRKYGLDLVETDVATEVLVLRE